jgi:hypothetical protein
LSRPAVRRAWRRSGGARRRRAGPLGCRRARARLRVRVRVRVRVLVQSRRCWRVWPARVLWQVPQGVPPRAAVGAWWAGGWAAAGKLCP